MATELDQLSEEILSSVLEYKAGLNWLEFRDVQTKYIKSVLKQVRDETIEEIAAMMDHQCSEYGDITLENIPNEIRSLKSKEPKDGI